MTTLFTGSQLCAVFGLSCHTFFLVILFYFQGQIWSMVYQVNQYYNHLASLFLTSIFFLNRTELCSREESILSVDIIKV